MSRRFFLTGLWARLVIYKRFIFLNDANFLSLLHHGDYNNKASYFNSRPTFRCKWPRRHSNIIHLYFTFTFIADIINVNNKKDQSIFPWWPWDTNWDAFLCFLCACNLFHIFFFEMVPKTMPHKDMLICYYAVIHLLRKKWIWFKISYSPTDWEHEIV